MPTLLFTPDTLDRRCEDLSFHVHTLLEDKKRITEELAAARGGKSEETGGSKQLKEELRDLQSALDKKVSTCTVHVYVAIKLHVPVYHEPFSWKCPTLTY